MKTLPVELLSQIFVSLDQEDQMQCMLVCSLWNNIIEKSCLFQTLHIYSSAFLDIILKKIQDKPWLSSNVLHLTIHFYNPDESSWVIFLESLPNVRTFRYFGSVYRSFGDEIKPQVVWHKTIQEITEISNHRIVHHMLQNNLCPNLTQLNIYSEDNECIPLFKNTPSLKSLTLNLEDIMIDDINKIHEALPHLKTFKLKDNFIMGDGLDVDIKPAFSVTEFIMTNVDVRSLTAELEVLGFIIQKYPNLTDLVYESTFNTEDDTEKEMLHAVGFDPLIKKLAPSLRKLHTSNTDKIQDFWDTLDKHRCQINNLKIDWLLKANFANIIKSQQSQFIQTLVISNVRFKSFTWLKAMKILESLEIQVDPKELPLRLDFNDIIDDSPSTLTSLTFSNVTLTAKLVNAKLTNIKNLAFIHTRLPKEVDRFIDRHFPLLSNLKFIGCDHLMKKLTLRSVELDSFSLVLEKDSSDVHVLVHTFYDDNERLYSTRDEKYYNCYREATRKYGIVDIPPAKSRPAGLLKMKYHIALYCYSVKKVILCR